MPARKRTKRKSSKTSAGAKRKTTRSKTTSKHKHTADTPPKRFQPLRPPPSLSEALVQCQLAARHGYDIARQNLRETSKAIRKVSKSLLQCLESIEDGSVRSPGIVDQLKEQLSIAINELEQLQRTSDLTLKERRKNLNNFTITLFGRTKAGKSTLMEILTQGDGQSIGKGAQRTTRDVRPYTWNSLEVIDVPGVAAFEGAEDEELAFKAAAKADLVLFLITDDAPQQAEAECLARVRRLGKPVLGILNVKVAVDEEDDLFLFLRNPERSFDRLRLKQLLNQFNMFADRHVPGKRIPFVFTHLRSRFLASQPQFDTQRDQLIVVSRFRRIESRIVNEVVGRGTFLRIKSFIDGAVAPMMELTDLLLEFSAQNSSSGRVLIDKRRQLYEWSQEFRANGQNRINTLISKTMDKLRDEVPSFAEDHFEDRAAGRNWNKLVESIGIDRKVKNLQKSLLNECKKELTEVARELKSELSQVASFVDDRHIKMDSIFNLKRTWNWGTTILSGGLGVAAIILGSGPLGWAAAAVGTIGWLISYFIDDREKKAQRARKNLSKKLLNNINKIERELHQALGDWFHQELLGKQVYVLLNDLAAVTTGLFELADAQRTLAWTLNDSQKSLGRTLIEEALVQLKNENLNDIIMDVARVPGLSTMLLIPPDTTFPKKVRADLERILGEQVWFVVDTKNQFSILAQSIGRDCNRNEIRIEEKIRVAHVLLDDLGAVAKARVRMAQQLTGLHVMR